MQSNWWGRTRDALLPLSRIARPPPGPTITAHHLRDDVSANEQGFPNRWCVGRWYPRWPNNNSRKMSKWQIPCISATTIIWAVEGITGNLSSPQIGKQNKLIFNYEPLLCDYDAGGHPVALLPFRCFNSANFRIKILGLDFTHRSLSIHHQRDADRIHRPHIHAGSDMQTAGYYN